MHRSNCLHRATSLASLILTLCLAGCGRVPDPDASLLRPDGSVRPSDPNAVPSDPASRTRDGRYALLRQAQRLERELGGVALRIEVDCCGPEAVDNAVELVHGLQSAHSLGNDAPVLVGGPDLRLAAAVVDELAEGGMTRVWLVVQ
jgi:hypothetical protein